VSSTLRIVGVDPGFAFLGWAAVDFSASSMRFIAGDTFKTTAKESPEERLDAIADQLFDVLEIHAPAAVGYENQAGVEAGMHRRAEQDGTERRSSYSSRHVHEAVGAIRAAARAYGLPCYVFAPATIKVALLGRGGGHAAKGRVKEAVTRFFGVSGSSHMADAVAIAVATVRKHRIEQMSVRRAGALIT
jgi:crossover junction endodeoxyribonuclease RuvC